jgi:hypothetical protein
MCSNTLCSKRATCYRFKAIPDEYGQTYAKFKEENDDGCSYYIEVKNLGTKRKKVRKVPKSKTLVSYDTIYRLAR